jgi:hypothetical protein
MAREDKINYKRSACFLAVIFCFFVFAFPLQAGAAATLEVSPQKGKQQVGVPFSVNIKVNTHGDAINAAEANLTFDKNLLNVVSVGTTSSIFSMWVEYPSYSNTNGTVHFSGGLPAPGFIGNGIILNVKFNPIAVGTAVVAFTGSGQVLANDGLGTNILNGTTNGTFVISPIVPSVSCLALPNPADVDQPVTYTATASGGDGTYTYAWSQDCAGTDSTCTKSYLEGGTKTAKITVTSAGQSVSATCSTVVNFSGLNISCSPSSGSVNVGEPVAYTSSASGGNGTYEYLWTGGCEGADSTCENSYDTSGSKITTLKVTSGGKSSSASCSISVGLPDLIVFCYASSSSVDPDTEVIFTSEASGGNGEYDYSWSGDCSGSLSTCSNLYNIEGLKTATVEVTSGGKSVSANCSTSVNTVCPVLPPEEEPPVPIEEEPPAPIETVKVVTEIVTNTITKTIIQRVPYPVRVATEETKKIVESPQGSAVTKTVSTTGAVVATAVTTGSLFSFSFFELLLLPLRLLGLLLTALGLRKKVAKWGVVYDSVTKQPIDPAYVVLKNVQGKNVASAITDLDGRFGFLVEPGVYQIKASKSNYVFPSQKLAGKTSDELYDNLYFGENINITKSGEIIAKNIPLDPIKFDWNEFTKKSKKLMRFYSKWDVILKKIYNLLFALGFVVAIGAFVLSPHTYNTVIMILYVLMLLPRFFGIKPRTYGYIVEKATGVPLSFPIIRVMIPEINKEILSRSADRYGKYYCLVPPGKYYVKIEKKNDDGSYTLAYTSEILNVSKKGIINEKFKI